MTTIAAQPGLLGADVAEASGVARRGARATSASAWHHYRIGAVPVMIRSQDRGVVSQFEESYRSYRAQVCEDDAVRIEVCTRLVGPWGKRFRILADGEERFAVRSRRELLPHVEWAINWQLAACQTRWLAIHSAVMARDGEALVLAAPPGHGKSTLAAALLARGWSYLSDEFALIDPDTLEVHAYPKALCIKQGSYEAVVRMGMPLETDRDHRKGKKGRVSFLNPLEIRPDAVAERARVRMVLFPRYEAGQTPAVHAMSAARGAFELTQLAFNYRQFRGYGLSLISRLMGGCFVGRLDAGETWGTCSVIEDAWSRCAGQPFVRDRWSRIENDIQC